MQFSDALCYVVLMITITSTCVDGSYTKKELEERRIDRRSKRQSSVIIDNAYPSTTYAAKPDLIFDRVSKSKYNSKPKHGRNRPQYGRSPPSKRGKPVKKYRRKLVRAHKFKKYVPTPSSHMHQHHSHKKPAKQLTSKKPPASGYGPPKMWNEYHPYYVSEPASFAEPPKYMNPEFARHPQKTYGEPPVDSYGVPVKHPDFQAAVETYESPLNLLQTAEPFAETPNNGNFGQQQQQYQSYQSYKQDVDVDNVNSYSKYHPVYAQHEHEVHEGNHPPDHDSSLNSYADVYKQSLLNDLTSNAWNQKTKSYHSVLKNRPWKSKFKNEDGKEYSQKHIMVGGQYAEPPGHLVPDVQPSLPEEFPGAADFGPNFALLDSEFAASATISPYVNYKNSNMAFSPQNLNDAFSL